jgi:hypothetical protein
MMRWFGTDWGAPVCQDTPHAETPIGETCVHCVDGFVADDRGVIITNAPLHLECFLRTVLGSAAHQEGRCSCFGGTGEDPPGMSKRESARAAQRAFHDRSVRAPDRERACDA